MPTYKITDPTTGNTMRVTGDSPPTEEEMTQLFGGDQGKTNTPQSWGQTAVESIGNIPGGAVNAALNIWNAVTSPVQTLTAIGNLVFGAASKQRGVDTPQAKMFDAVKDSIVADYGSYEGFKKAVAKDPVAVLMDLSTVAGGVGGILEKAGTVSKVSAIAKAGEMASASAKVLDPVNIAGNIVKKPLQAVGNIAAQGVGAVTGVGSTPLKVGLKEAMETPIGQKTQFLNYARGGGNAEDILDTTLSSLGKLRDERNLAYRNKLDELSQVTTPIDSAPVKTFFDDKLKKYGIKVVQTVDQNGNTIESLDFGRSPLRGDPRSITDINRIKEIIDDWSATPQHSVSDMDILKKQLDNFYNESSKSKELVATVKKNVVDTITDRVPDYTNLTKPYAEVTDFIRQFDKALSTSSMAERKLNVSTALTKLTNALKENKEFAQQYVAKLEEASGASIQPMIAGQSMQSWIPKGFVGRSMGAAEVWKLIETGDPKLLMAMSLGSPRSVAEFINVIGKTTRLGKKAYDFMPEGSAKALFQAGRASGFDTVNKMDNTE